MAIECVLMKSGPSMVSIENDAPVRRASVSPAFQINDMQRQQPCNPLLQEKTVLESSPDLIGIDMPQDKAGDSKEHSTHNRNDVLPVFFIPAE